MICMVIIARPLEPLRGLDGGNGSRPAVMADIDLRPVNGAGGARAPMSGAVAVRIGEKSPRGGKVMRNATIAKHDRVVMLDGARDTRFLSRKSAVHLAAALARRVVADAVPLQDAL